MLYREDYDDPDSDRRGEMDIIVRAGDNAEGNRSRTS